MGACGRGYYLIKDIISGDPQTSGGGRRMASSSAATARGNNAGRLGCSGFRHFHCLSIGTVAPVSISNAGDARATSLESR
jgi:hypothetical protein